MATQTIQNMHKRMATDFTLLFYKALLVKGWWRCLYQGALTHCTTHSGHPHNMFNILNAINKYIQTRYL